MTDLAHIVVRFSAEGYRELDQSLTNIHTKGAAVEGATGKAASGIKSTGSASKTAGVEVEKLGSQFGTAGQIIIGFADQLLPGNLRFQDFGVAGGIAVGVTAVLALGMFKAVEAAADAERSYGRLGAIVKATGNASGQTADQLRPAGPDRGPYQGRARPA